MLLLKYETEKPFLPKPSMTACYGFLQGSKPFTSRKPFETLFWNLIFFAVYRQIMCSHIYCSHHSWFTTLNLHQVQQRLRGLHLIKLQISSWQLTKDRVNAQKNGKLMQFKWDDKEGEIWAVDCSYTVNGVNLDLGDNFENYHKFFMIMWPTLCKIILWMELLAIELY